MVREAAESLYVRVAAVRVQNKFGAIFFGHRVNPDGEICDVDEDVTVNLQQNAVGVRLCEGQRWRVTGRVALRSVLTVTGFKRVERTVFVSVGGASLVRSSGSQIRDYLRRHPDLVGVGLVTANRLWDHFGEHIYDVLDDGNIEALRTVVSPEKAALIVEVWAREGVSQTIQFLASFEIPPVVGRRVVEVHGTSAMDVLRSNPYRLLSYSSTWKEVDKVAESLGIPSDDGRRLSAACEAVLFSQFSAGHTFVPGEEMRARLAQLLVSREPGAPRLGELALRLASETGRVLLDSAENFYSLGACFLEMQAAERIQRMIRCAAETFDADAFVGKYEAREKLGFKLNERQREAVGLVATQHFAVITGGAGCGKTTVLRVVCEMLESQGFSVTQLALSGKAVKRMSEASGRTAVTIASFLKRRTSEGSGDEGGSPALGTKDAFIIDEASMVDIISFAAIMRVADDDAKIVLIGDPNQLPPVGPGLVLHVLTGGAAPHVQLEVSNRFGSQIAAFANAIRDGFFPRVDKTNPSVQLLEPDATQDYALCAADLYLQDPSDAIVLCHSRSLAARINALIQAQLTEGNKPLVVWNHQYDARQDLRFREKDFVICTKNLWEAGLQNGSIGQIVSIDDSDLDSVSGVIAWDDGEGRPFNLDLIEHLELAYALTIHKSQGSQWRRVILCIPSARMADRSLIYTGVTRATEAVIVVGRRDKLEAVVCQPKAADRRRVALHKWLHAMAASG